MSVVETKKPESLSKIQAQHTIYGYEAILSYAIVEPSKNATKTPHSIEWSA